MTDAPDTNEDIDFTNHVVGTNAGDPGETVAQLLGTDQPGSDSPVISLTEQFREYGTTRSAEDYFLDDETRHELHFNDRVEHVPCVADALIAAALVDHEPVTVRSFDPVTDEPVTFTITDNSIDVTPDEHVVSIGMSSAFPESETMISVIDGDMNPQQHYEDPLSHCQFINAFESVDTYEQWARDTDAVTVALPAEPLMAGIRQFVTGPVFD